MRNLFLILLLTSCAAAPVIAPKPARFKIGDRVCASPCPTSCDLVVKEIAADGGVWTEPACSGPRGLYSVSDLKLNQVHNSEDDVALEKSCPKPGEFQAVDASGPVSQKFLDVMKTLKIKTLIRYGDYVNETIAGKTPRPAERKLIRDNGFEELFVFQHNNSKISSFTADRGKADAERMLELYSDVPAWYYGVDLDVGSSDINKVVMYAIAFKAVAEAHGKKVGAYGSGFVLQKLKNVGLIDYTWISQSSGFNGTKEFTASGKWTMHQAMPMNCGGMNVDFNKVN